MNDIKTLYSGKYLNLVEVNGWEYVTRNAQDVVVIFPVLESGHILLIKEFRKPLDKHIISLPAGLVGDKGEEEIFDAARRELLEETGYKTNCMELVLENSPSSSGMTNETFNFIMASKLTKINDGGGDDTEDIEVLELNPSRLDSKVKNWIEEGCLIDPKIYMGLYFLDKKYT